MVFFNYALRKLNAKIVYYGPGLCGKTTNLVWVHDHFEGGERGKMISLATEGDRTIFFDLLPLEIGSIRGMNVTLQLYTVPGQVHYNSTRQLVLRGADGVVFVADSQRTMRESNIESFRNLQENLLLQGISLDGFPLVLQFNKRDLKDILSPEELDSDLNLYRAPFFEATATEGVGVQETLEGIVKLVMRNLRERYEGVGAGAREAALKDPAATMRAQPPQASSGPRAVPPKQPPATPPPAAAKPSQQVRPPAAKPEEPQRQPAVKPPPARPQPPEQRAVTPPAQPSPRPPRQQVPPPDPRPAAPATAPPKPAAAKAPAPKPAAQRPAPPKAPAPPPAPEAPSEEVVFPEADGSITFDFSENDSPVFGDQKPKGGFEDEVSTAVYEDEIEVGPEDFREAVESHAPAKPASFVDEPTKTRAGELEDLDFARLRGQVQREPATPLREEPELPKPDEPIWPSEAASESAPYEPEPYTFDEPEPVSVEPEPAQPGWSEPELEEGEIQFLGTDEPSVDLPPPAAPVREASSSGGNDRYVDRIQAPSPFAPREPGPVGAQTAAASAFEAQIEEPFPEAPATEPTFEVPPSADLDDSALGDVSAAWDTPPPEPLPPAGVDEGPPAAAEPEVSPVFMDEELFSDEVTPVDLSAEDEAPPAIVPTSRREVDVRAEDNQLHLRLQGTGAIVESGQVRALDIEVPVPGAWVGHRRVTLQLRLTLTPDSEAEDGGSGGHS